MSRNQASSQHEFALIAAGTTTRTNTHLAVARDPRIKTACAECKRRKTKCDGTQPCYSCRWYKQPERCVYAFSRPAIVLSRKNFESVRQRMEDATNIVLKLFPSPSIDDLTGLSRDELLERLGSPSQSLASGQDSVRTAIRATSDERDVPESVEPLPVDTADHDPLTVNRPQSPSNGKSVDVQLEDDPSEAGDDVNALSAPSGQPSSYVGPSSTMQMFRTILRIAPEPRGNQTSSQSPETSQRSGSIRSLETTYRTPSAIQMTERVSILIDAYFAWVHPATPILDEDDFKRTAALGSRNDPPWLCLFNMVLALGSIGTTRTESREHLTFYHAAKSHLDLEGLGNKSLETLQALILMAGWYNHYRNRPNLASALLGAAFRMAYALGLHKDIRNSNEPVELRQLRRQIWWNLVVFDAAEAVTLGRTLDTKIFENEVQYPQEISPESTKSPSIASSLVVTIGFSRTMTEIQSRLMTATTLPFAESLSLDAHLVDWYEGLPGDFHMLVGVASPVTLDASLKKFIQPLVTIKWRYLNLRTLLYRPSLMEAVLHRIPFNRLTSDQRLCIRKCLTLSGETVDSVKTRASEPANQYIAWPSTWYLLQICMIPLLSLYVFREDAATRDASLQNALIQQAGFKYSNSAKEQVRQIRDECHRQVRVTLQLMKEMEPWAVASGKMHDLIKHLYEARDQHLRVWNNTEDSPVLVLGSPGNIQPTEANQPLSGPPQTTQKSSNQKTIPAPINGLPPEYSVTSWNHLPVQAASHPNHESAPYGSTSSNQFEPFSRDWSMYNSFTWPNATLESLFDLPDEFQYMGQDPFDMG